MKIERFLNWIQDKLLNYPDISIITVKMFMDKFQSCLSTKEIERHLLHLSLIREFTSQQISLDYFVHNNKIEILSNELDKLKNDDKNE